MSASAVFIMDTQGKVILSRNYRGDLPMSAAENFTKIINTEFTEPLPPVINDGEINYLYITHNNLILMAMTKKNANAMLLFAVLYSIVNVLESYFNILNEESIHDNFVITYELLDEMMDFGTPQATDAAILKEFINFKDTFQFFEEKKPPPTIPEALTQKVARRANIHYAKNEVFLDVVEKLNLLVGSDGSVLSSEIIGALQMKTCLSGMPELKLGLNDKVFLESRGITRTKGVEMEDIRFHQCVDFSKFEQDRTISFVPPDGEFELMSYRLAAQVRPLILIDAHVEAHSGSRVKYLVKIKSNYKKQSCASNVKIIIPVPSDADSPLFSLSNGFAEYVPERDCIVWTIKQLQGGKELTLRAQLGLPSIGGDDTYIHAKPPIRVEFEIPYFTVSGIQIRYLKITERSRYNANPWVRYITQSGDYEVRF